MPEPIVELTEDQKTGNVGLTEDQFEKIGDSVGDWDAPDEAKKKLDEPEGKEPEEKEDEQSVEGDNEGEGVSDEEQKAETERLDKKASELGKSVEEVRDLETKDAEAEKVESERIAKVAEEQSKTVEEVVEEERLSVEQTENDRLAEVAKTEGVTVEEVKENEKKDQAILERHSNDPQKVARALRLLQSESAKTKNELDKISAETVARSRVSDENDFNKRCEEGHDSIVEQYRKAYPDKSDELTDDACFELGKAELRPKWQTYVDNEKTEVKAKADGNRKSLVEGLDPEVKKEFGNDITGYLSDCTDAQVLHPQFDMDQIVQLHRGMKYTPDHVKGLEDAAFKRGAEQKKILGAKSLGPKVSTPSAPDKSGAKIRTTLNDAEKQRARDMYAGTNMTEQQMYKDYEKDKDNDF